MFIPTRMFECSVSVGKLLLSKAHGGSSDSLLKFAVYLDVPGKPQVCHQIYVYTSHYTRLVRVRLGEKRRVSPGSVAKMEGTDSWTD